MMDEDVKREWWKGELAAGALVFSLLGLAGSTFNLSMNVGRFVENTTIQLDQIKDYIDRDEKNSVTQIEKTYILEKISNNSADIRRCQERTNASLKTLESKVDKLLLKQVNNGK